MHRSVYPIHKQSHWCTHQHIHSTNSLTDAQVSVSRPQTVPLMHTSAYPVHKQSHWCTGQHFLSTESPTVAQVSISVHKQSHWCTGQCILSTNSPTVAQVIISHPQAVLLLHRSSYPVNRQFPVLLLKPLYLTPFTFTNVWSFRALRVPTCDSCMVLSPGCLNAFHHTKIFSFLWTLSSKWGQALLCSRMMLSVKLLCCLFWILSHSFWSVWQWWFALMYRYMAQRPEAGGLQYSSGPVWTDTPS